MPSIWGGEHDGQSTVYRIVCCKEAWPLPDLDCHPPSLRWRLWTVPLQSHKLSMELCSCILKGLSRARPGRSSHNNNHNDNNHNHSARGGVCGAGSPSAMLWQRPSKSCRPKPSFPFPPGAADAADARPPHPQGETKPRIISISGSGLRLLGAYVGLKTERHENHGIYSVFRVFQALSRIRNPRPNPLMLMMRSCGPLGWPMPPKKHQQRVFGKS